MRILHIYSGNLYGGIEKFLTTLAVVAQSDRLHFEFALCFDGRLSRDLRSVGAQVHLLGPVRTLNLVSVINARRRLRTLLQKSKFDCVICHAAWSQALFSSIAVKAGSQQVFWLHDAIDGTHWLERWSSLTRPNLIVCNSKYTSRKSAWLLPKVARAVVHCPIPLQPQTSIGERAQSRAEWRVPPETPVVIQTSRLEPWKGHQSLLHALSRLKASDKFACWIVGGPQRPHEHQYFAELQELTRNLGLSDRVTFLGQRSDVPRLLAAADIHCQPNQGPEPFGIAFVEALQAGLPVVTTALGAAPEIIDESCGILVPPDDVEALAGALGQLMRNPILRQSLGSNGPERAQHLCGPDLQISNLLRFLAA